MSARVIRIPRELYLSLPVIYQNIARIGTQTGQVVLVDEWDLLSSDENAPEHDGHSKTRISHEEGT